MRLTIPAAVTKLRTASDVRALRSPIASWLKIPLKVLIKAVGARTEAKCLWTRFKCCTNSSYSECSRHKSNVP